MFHPNPVDCNITYIVPDLQSNNCSQTQQPCYTLSQHPAGRVQSSNITFMFFFQEITTSLTMQLSIAKIDHLTLSALDDNATINYTQMQSGSGNVLLEAIQEVHISNVDFSGCIMSQMISISLVTLIDSHFQKQGSGYHSTLELVDVNAIFISCYFSAENFEMGYSNGALVMIRSNVSITNSFFVGNHAQRGGAIHATRGSNVSLKNSEFQQSDLEWSSNDKW